MQRSYAAFVIVLIATSPLMAQSEVPDISGTWNPRASQLPEGYTQIRFPTATPDEIPFLPETRDRFDATVPLDDPQTRCIPRGSLRYTATTIYPVDILQTPEKIVMLFNQHSAWRRVFTDGRQHPDPTEITYFGHSIGHWEGDTLVVDTVGEHPATWMNSGERGLSHTEQMRVVERIRPIEDGQFLEFDVTVEDPGAYTAPMRIRYYWMRDNIDFPEFVCEEGLQLSGDEPEPLFSTR